MAIKYKPTGSRRKRNILVTGGAGFAGSHLLELLLEEGYKPFASVNSDESIENISHLKKSIEIIRCDVRNKKQVEKMISKVGPVWVFHLAAISSVGDSFDNDRLTYEVNFTGTLNLLESLRNSAMLQKFISIGSPDCYGIFSPHAKLLKEDQPLNPISPYGISKVAAENIARLNFRQQGFPAVFVRPFNHTGPRQADRFVIPSFCKQIAEIENGLRKPVLMVGDLSARRDLSDVRDIVSGYLLAAQKGQPGEIYHLSSGRAVAISTTLKTLLGLTEREIKVKVDPERLRPVDIPCLKGDN
ncbi:MAG: SDR family NAD(P)-dependent oxidoreductase, partial [candidate division Zixibacteria bacterium]|nr:SDR family NAD(P)-dependent oxidoreductase [candidate division Zixibacteria bacterium]